MNSLDKDLPKAKISLVEFGELTQRVLTYLPNIISGFEEKNNYLIFYSDIAGIKKFIRPINKMLF